MKDYKIGKHLGAGAYASVKLAVHEGSGLIVAIKLYTNVNSKRRKSIMRESSLLRKL